MSQIVLKNNIKKFRSSSILCIGDIILDEYIYGTAERISPEAPVPILLESNKSCQLGGVGNVARNISAVGGNAHILSVIGHDLISKSILDLIKREKNISSTFVKLRDYSAPVKKRYVSNKTQLLRVDNENINYMKANIKEKLLKKFKKIAKYFDVIIVSDYGKGFFDRDILSSILKYGKKNGLSTLVDPKRDDFSFYNDAFMITPNKNELSLVFGKKFRSKNEIIKAGKETLIKYNLNYLLVTLSEEGMILFKSNGHTKFLTTAKEVYDVSGAGDTVIAFVALGLSVNLGIEKCIKLANIAAGIVVGKSGTAVINTKDIK